MEEIIQQMLSAQISMRAFLDVISSNSDLISCINNLIPNDSINNVEHPIWLSFSYDAMEKVNFKIWDEIKNIASFDNSLGDNLNIFGVVKIFYCYSHPDFRPTTKYKEEFGLLLDVAGETYGGPEVEKLINDIISQYVSITPKTRRIREAKEKIAAVFHVFDKKTPHWINGAEWPMGLLSPMQFIEEKRIEDGKLYRFQDIDTTMFCDITQYY